MKFVNRMEELELLEKLWQQDRALVVLYGRRRVGKTRLMQEFTSPRDTFFFTFSNIAVARQLREFRERAAEYLRDDMILKIGGDWYDTLRYFFRVMKDGATVVLDEFTYAIKSDRKIVSDIQNLWDGELRERKLKILICGSMLGMVRDDLLSHTSPLYGRRTADIHLGDLGYRHALEFFPDPAYGIEAYMLVGGMPEYLLVAARHDNLRDLVSGEFLDQKGYFYREPYYMLSQDLKDMKVYFAILNAVAYGKTRPGEIANFVGLPGRSIYPYLDNLQRLEFIRREVPLGGSTRKGIYRLSRPMIRSWFNIVYGKRHEIEAGTATFLPGNMNRILGTAFENLCIQYLGELNRRGKPGMGRIGRWWHKGEEIDIACLDEGKRNVVLIEVKHSKLETGKCMKIFRELERKSGLTPWTSGEWNIEYGIMAREIEGKEYLRKDGYLCYDMSDIIRTHFN